MNKFADAQHPQGYPPAIPTPDAPRWFMTFGLGTPHRNQYALLKAQEYTDARAEAFERYGRAWGFMYPIEDLEDQKRQYGMTERAD